LCSRQHKTIFMKYFAFLFFFAFAAFSCDKDDDSCPTNVICTEEYRMITVSVVDTSGNPVDLDMHEVYIQGSMIPFNIIDDSWQAGTYIIIADDKMNVLDRYEPTTFRFDGYLSGELVVREYYQVRHDCCHVVLVSGNTNVTI
jgi:hypothetical protein